LAQAYEAKRSIKLAISAHRAIAGLEPDAIESHLALLRLGMPLKQVLSLAPPVEWMRVYIESHAQNLAHDYQAAKVGFTYLEQNLFTGNADLMLMIADACLKIGDVHTAHTCYKNVRKAEPMLIDDMDKFAGMIRKQGKSILVNHLAEDLLQVSDTRPECFVILARYSEMNDSIDRALVFLDKVCHFNLINPRLSNSTLITWKPTNYAETSS
jgi:hypothetical protein